MNSYYLFFKKIIVSSFFTLLLTMLAVSPARAGIEQTPARLEQIIPELLDYYNVPGTGVAVFVEGEVWWSGYYGLADRESQREVKAETLFRAESLTKSLTAWAIYSLAGEGSIDLDDPVVDYLERWQFPESEYSEEEVTFRLLLTHSAGISGESESGLPEDDRPELTAVLNGEYGLAETRLVREPGSEFAYSDQAFALAELLVEEITGRDFANYVQAEILQPLGVEAYFTLDEEVEERLAVSYNFQGDRLPLYLDNFRGAAGLLITPENLAKFFARTSRQPYPGIYQAAISPAGFYDLAADGAAPGHFIEYFKQNGEAKGVFNAGEGTGSLGLAYIFPEMEEGIVILTNSNRSWPLLLELVGRWAESRDLPQPTMSQTFAMIAIAAQVLIFVIIALAIFNIWRLVTGYRDGDLIFSPRTQVYLKRRMAKIGLAFALVIGWRVLGSVIITNLLPVLYNYVGLALAFLALTLVFSTAFIDVYSLSRD